MSGFTVVVSLDRSPGRERAEYQDALCARLRDAGWPVLIVPDLYHLTDGESTRALRDLAGPVVLLSWYAPRAAYWICRSFGVEGRRVDSLRNAGPGPRPIVCLDLSAKCCPGKWIETLRDMGAAADGAAACRQIAEATTPRWYPVVDYDRCTGCGECQEFCLFGVFDVDEEGTTVAASPGLCKPGCPACSRVCPATAIMFPLCEEDEVIAGAEEGTVAPFRAEDVARVRAACASGELTQDDVVRACVCNDAGSLGVRSAACGCSAGCDCDGDGERRRSGDRRARAPSDAIDSMLDGIVGR